MRFLCLIVLGSLLTTAANAQNGANRSFVLNEAKPYVYIAFDHAGNRKPLGHGETKHGLWLKFVNNCRVPVTLATFELGTGDPGIGVFHDVVPYQAGGVKGIPGPQEQAPSKAAREEPPIQAMTPPEGYSGEVSSTTTVVSGESVLFSVPSNHLSPNWYLRVRFMLAVSPSRIGDQPYSYADFRWEQLPDAVKLLKK
jgi:hypothetical protein